MTAKIQLPTEPSYYGSECTHEDVERITSNLIDMIRAQFPDVFIGFERTSTPHGSGVTADTDDLRVEIEAWIAENWTAAL